MKMADPILQISDFQLLTPGQQTKIRQEATKGIAAVFKIVEADHATQSPLNAYIREIFNFGIEGVWNHLMTSGAIDFTTMGYSKDADTRLKKGLEILRERYVGRYEALFTLTETELEKTKKVIH